MFSQRRHLQKDTENFMMKPFGCYISVSIFLYPSLYILKSLQASKKNVHNVKYKLRLKKYIYIVHTYVQYLSNM